MVARPARILVIDDAPDFRSFMQTLLEYHGYRVRTAGSMAAARAALAAGRPDLIVADLYMPDVTPADLVNLLATEVQVYRVPVLLCTAAVLEVEAIRPTVEASGLEILLKPFEIDDLLERVERLIERGGAQDPGGWGAK